MLFNPRTLRICMISLVLLFIIILVGREVWDRFVSEIISHPEITTVWNG